MQDATPTGADIEPRTLAPHAPLARFYADEQERHRFLRRIFGPSAGDAVLDVGIGRGLVP